MNKSNRFYVQAQCLHVMTGSCFLFTAHYPNGKTEKFLFECGRFEDSQKELNEFFPFDPKECNFLIASHAHDDHISRIPLLVKHGFTGKIYTTYTTSKFANFILYNNSHIYAKNQEERHMEPLYNDADVESALRKFVSCPYRRTIKASKNISFTLYENGHLPGACIIYLVVSYPGEKDIVILFTGDYHYRNMFYNVPSLPETVTKNYISLFITESTYGNTNSYDCNQEGKLIRELSAYLSAGKTVLMPAFALNRSSSCAYLTGNAQKAGILPSVPIWFDGPSAIRFHNMYCYENIGISINPRDLLPPTLKYITSPVTRNRVLADKNPKVIISPGGFSDQGSVVSHMKNAIPREDVAILYTGYTSPTSVAKKLQLAKKGDSIVYLGNEFEVRCDVNSTSELSGHAKKDEFFEHLFLPCSYTNSYIVTHGDPPNSQALAKDLSTTFPKANVGVINPMTSYKIDASGIVQADSISIY